MTSDIAKFISEMGVMKLSKRTGWWMEGVKDPDSLADHTFRTMTIGYILAKMEKADENKVLKMLLFHDVPEIRTNDFHAIAKRYINNKSDIERKVLEEQVSRLSGEMSDEIKALMHEYEENKTKESVVAKDADSLELLATVQENIEMGYKNFEYWKERNSLLLKTDSAKKIFAEIEKLKLGAWRQGLEHL